MKVLCISEFSLQPQVYTLLYNRHCRESMPNPGRQNKQTKNGHAPSELPPHWRSTAPNDTSNAQNVLDLTHLEQRAILKPDVCRLGLIHSLPVQLEQRKTTDNAVTICP